MPTLRMKETPKPASTATEKSLKTEFVVVPTSYTKRVAAELARTWKTGFKPKSTPLAVP